MNDLLNYALGKCFQENILRVPQRSYTRRSNSQVIDIEQRKNTKVLTKNLISGDLYTELEYSPGKARQKSVNDVQLPKIEGFRRLFFENHLTHESDQTTTKRKYSERQRSQTRKKQKGYLLIDINGQQLTVIYRKLLEKMNSEFTRYHLSLYLQKYLGQSDYVNKFLQLLNFPSIITLSTFRGVMTCIKEMQQEEILQCSFQTFDLDCKEFLSVTDLFNMFKSDGVIQQDADYIFKSQPSIQMEKSKHIRRINLTNGKQKPILITLFKDSPNKKVRRCLDTIINFQAFSKIFNDRVPEFFKEFIRLMFYDFT